MKSIRLNIQHQADREKIIIGLINSGYTVRMEEIEEQGFLHRQTYWIVVEVDEENITPHEMEKQNDQ